MPPLGKTKPKFSIQTITALVEVVTGGAGGSERDPIGIYRSGTTLEQFLGAANIELRIGGDSRVPAVRDILTRTNRQPYGDIQITKLIDLIVDPREYTRDEDKVHTVAEYLNKFLKHDGFVLKMVGDRYQLMRKNSNASVTIGLREKAADLSLDSVSKDFDRALGSAEEDPEGAITSACSTVESVCKCLLEEMGEPLPAKQDISGLMRVLQKRLDLAPGRADLEEDIKRILSGLTTVAGGIGSLRTHGGDAHGRGRSVRQVDSRIARLAIHAASTLSIFLLETWEREKARKSQR